MLALGASKPWPDAMEVLTGTRKMEANAIMEYFKPLHDWLIKSNEANGLHVGWKKTYRKSLCEKKKNIFYNIHFFLQNADKRK